MYLLVFVVDDDVLRFDVPVHDADAVGVVQSLQDLIYVEFAIVWFKYLKQFPVLGGGHMFHDQAEDFSLLHNVQQFDAVVPASQGHQNFYLPIYFSEFD